MLISKKYVLVSYIHLIPYNVHQTVHSPLFSRKIIEIKCFALQAVILHECQNYLHLLRGLKIKMAAINGNMHYISTISRKNRGL